MSWVDSLLIPLAIGIAFGFALERAGLGDARKLAGQFYLSDFAVFKVMFSALVTAMLGAFWLGRLGLVDLNALHVPETFLAPQAAGGVIFGVGFVISGLCPGTSCVAAASGRIDGVAVVGGLFVGVFATGLAFPLIETFYSSTPHGVFTLPDLLQAPYGLVVAIVTGLALVAFRLLERFERRT